VDRVSWALLEVAFVLAWLLIPLIVIHYRLRSVPLRYEEVRDAFLWRGATGKEEIGVPDETIPAWCYLKTLRPLEARGLSMTKVKASLLLAPIREQYLQLHAWPRYILGLVIIMMLSAFTLMICHAWILFRLTGDIVRGPSGLIAWLPLGLHAVPADVVAALAGAFVWSLYEIISRRNSRDLTADELYPIVFRLATAVPIGLAFTHLASVDFKPAMAFAATVFPFRDITRVIRQYLIREAQKDPISTEARRMRGYLGATLQGFSHDTVSRLEELNIVTVLDMAYADPVCLMFKTGTPLRQVITWLDESLLAVYAGPRTADFARQGVPCSIDLVNIWQRFEKGMYPGVPDPKAHMQALAKSVGMEPEVLEDLIRRIEKDPQVQFIASIWNATEPVEWKLAKQG